MKKKMDIYKNLSHSPRYVTSLCSFHFRGFVWACVGVCENVAHVCVFLC